MISYRPQRFFQPWSAAGQRVRYAPDWRRRVTASNRGEIDSPALPRIQKSTATEVARSFRWGPRLSTVLSRLIPWGTSPKDDPRASSLRWFERGIAHSEAASADLRSPAARRYLDRRTVYGSHRSAAGHRVRPAARPEGGLGGLDRVFGFLNTLVTPRQLKIVLWLAAVFFVCNVLGYWAVWAYAWLRGGGF